RSLLADSSPASEGPMAYRLLAPQARRSTRLTPCRQKRKGLMTRTIGRLVRISCSLAVTLVLGLLAAAPVRAGCIMDGQGGDDVPGQKDLSELCEPGPTDRKSVVEVMGGDLA